MNTDRNVSPGWRLMAAIFVAVPLQVIAYTYLCRANGGAEAAIGRWRPRKMRKCKCVPAVYAIRRRRSFVASGDNLAAPPPRGPPDPASRRAAAAVAGWDASYVKTRHLNCTLCYGYGNNRFIGFLLDTLRSWRKLCCLFTLEARKPLSLSFLSSVCCHIVHNYHELS